MAVDLDSLIQTVALNVAANGGVRHVQGDEGSTTFHDPVDQLIKLEELRATQRRRSTPPVPRFNGLQTFSHFAGLLGSPVQRFDRR